MTRLPLETGFSKFEEGMSSSTIDTHIMDSTTGLKTRFKHMEVKITKKIIESEIVVDLHYGL